MQRYSLLGASLLRGFERVTGVRDDSARVWCRECRASWTLQSLEDTVPLHGS